ncbi:metal ABC transporter solute-binding protein, Zn/Mn family [Thioalbus denitrificans]|uniref:Protein SCO1/2 n=1 Tax=Thioalbus denitrificans TaxID=547122 RepID=A0A369CG49_9GAMM|nr:SCO family protein [Thioalbus denitrificans]RCX32218.1 protein SCO1/2 [Thioalbus denitrificans]
MRLLSVRLALAGFLLLLTSGAWAAEVPKVVVSIKPIHSLVAGLMENVAEPTLLIDSGSPLTYRPTAVQQARIAEADLVFWVGPELEQGLAEALPGIQSRGRVLALLDNQNLKILSAPGNPDLRDPFFWLDTRNALILLDEIAELLVEMDPGREHLYMQNRERMRTVLSSLDWELEVSYRALKSGRVYLYDPTQQYFSQAYAMRSAGSLNALPGGPADAASLLKARATLGSGEATCLLYEAAFPAENLGLLQTEGVQQVKLDSFGSDLEPGPMLYPDMMRGQFKAIAGCFGEETPAIGREKGHTVLDDTVAAVPSAQLVGRYMLLDQNGALVTNETFLGSYQLIYFGYTFCPDICPTSLQVMAAGLSGLGKKAERIQPLFITVDPERDTPPVMRQYVGYFHPRLVGLTGTPEMIERVAEQFRVRYEKYLPEGAPPDRYSMDHTASLYLLDPDGVFITKFAHGITAQQLAAELDQLIQ